MMVCHAAAAGGLPYPSRRTCPCPTTRRWVWAPSGPRPAAASPFSGPLRPLDTFRVLAALPAARTAVRLPPRSTRPGTGTGHPRPALALPCLACHGGPANGLAPRVPPPPRTSPVPPPPALTPSSPSACRCSARPPGRLDQREEVPSPDKAPAGSQFQDACCGDPSGTQTASLPAPGAPRGKNSQSRGPMGLGFERREHRNA